MTELQSLLALLIALLAWLGRDQLGEIRKSLEGLRGDVNTVREDVAALKTDVSYLRESQ